MVDKRRLVRRGSVLFYVSQEEYLRLRHCTEFFLVFLSLGKDRQKEKYVQN